MMQRCNKKRVAFTIIEFMLAVGILVVALVGLLGAYVGAFALTEFSKGLTLAINSAQAQMEIIKNANFTDLDSFDSTTFDPAGFSPGNAKGRIEVSSIGNYTDLKKARIIVCWRQKSGRIVGEDGNLNGVQDLGEGNIIPPSNSLNSPCEIVSLVGNIEEE